MLRAGGDKRRGRDMTMFGKGVGATKVDAPMVIEANLNAFHEDYPDVPIYHSQQGAVCTVGISREKAIPAKYFVKVFDKHTGAQCIGDEHFSFPGEEKVNPALAGNAMKGRKV